MHLRSAIIHKKETNEEGQEVEGGRGEEKTIDCPNGREEKESYKANLVVEIGAKVTEIPLEGCSASDSPSAYPVSSVHSPPGIVAATLENEKIRHLTRLGCCDRRGTGG